MLDEYDSIPDVTAEAQEVGELDEVEFGFASSLLTTDLFESS